MIRPFYFADEIFYWARIGNRPTVLEFQCVLAGEAEPQALGEALLKALQVHTNFRARPVVSRGQFYSKLRMSKIRPCMRRTAVRDASERMRQRGCCSMPHIRGECSRSMFSTACPIFAGSTRSSIQY